LFGRGRGQAIRNAINAISEKIPYGGKQVTVLLETVAASLISKTIICIDDVERLGSGIEMGELMGLVSELKVEAECKIILMFNEEQLGSRAQQYEQASEKVVDKRLTFTTTAAEAVDLGLPAGTPMREHVATAIEALGISNIRTVQKIANGAHVVNEIIGGCSTAVQKQAAIAIVVFAGALYEGGIGFPKPEQVIRYNWFSTAMGVGVDEISEEWRDKLHACGFLSCDEFDTEILLVMKHGYAHGSELATHAQSLDEVADRARLDAVFTDAWNVFHDRIDGTAEELMHRFVSAVDEAATAISPLNLNSTVKLLRDLGFGAQADEVIESYIAANSARSGVFRIDDTPWGKDIDDERLRKRFAEALTEEEGPMDLSDAAALVLEGNGWSDRMEAALTNASPDDYAALIRSNQGDAMRTLIDALYRAASVRGEKTSPIATSVTAVLDGIAQESQLNAVRVRRWRR
jgi:hypothetical protein